MVAAVAKADLTAQRLRDVLHYDPETGLFRWRERHSLRSRPGQVAGTLNKAIGYVVFRVDKRLYYAHRLAWLYVTGEWPAHGIDHINGQRADNRWTNLRDVEQAINTQNQRAPHSHGTSGYLGVSFDKRSGKWRAIVTLDDKQIEVGTFHTPEVAHAAYLAAKRRVHEGCTI